MTRPSDEEIERALACMCPKCGTTNNRSYNSNLCRSCYAEVRGKAIQKESKDLTLLAELRQARKAFDASIVVCRSDREGYEEIFTAETMKAQIELMRLRDLVELGELGE